MQTTKGFEACPQTTGYNSHGYWATLREIIDVEADRDNAPFDEFPQELVDLYGDYPAIWVTTDPYDAFLYDISASEYNEPRAVIKTRYPDWKEQIETIDCTNCLKVSDTDDGDGGFLIVDFEHALGGAKLRQMTS